MDGDDTAQMVAMLLQRVVVGMEKRHQKAAELAAASHQLALKREQREEEDREEDRKRCRKEDQQKEALFQTEQWKNAMLRLQHDNPLVKSAGHAMVRQLRSMMEETDSTNQL